MTSVGKTEASLQDIIFTMPAKLLEIYLKNIAFTHHKKNAIVLSHIKENVITHLDFY